MRVMIVHNYYGSAAPSGENAVVDAERTLLANAGHDVHLYSRTSDEIIGAGTARLLAVASQIPWSVAAYRGIRRMLIEVRPDIMHVHNTFPLLSPAVFYAARHTSTATVMTVHNYRLFCAAGNHMRSDKVCTDCYDRNSVLPALLHGCYRGRFRTVPVAASIALHRKLGTWTNLVDAFVAQTEYQRERLVAGGLPECKLFVKPHFCTTPSGVLPWNVREDKVVHIGRLSRQKGVHVLLKAWARVGTAAPNLELIGDGPDRGALEDLARSLGLEKKVRFLGLIPEPAKYGALRTAKLLVMPTLWFETFGLVVAEAFAHGVPVVCSNLSCLPSIVSDGVNGRLVPAGDADALATTIGELWRNPGLLSWMARKARETHEERHRAEDNVRMLEAIYESAKAHRGDMRSVLGQFATT